MTLKKKCTELLKTAVVGTQNTLSAINPEKIAENIDSVRNKTCEKLATFKEKLEAELAKYETETNGEVKDDASNEDGKESKTPVDEVKDFEVKNETPTEEPTTSEPQITPEDTKKD